jgi:DNA repair protein RadA/Sms
VRPVNQADIRLKEAKKLGFKGALAPVSKADGLSIVTAESLADLIRWVKTRDS